MFRLFVWISFYNNAQFAAEEHSYASWHDCIESCSCNRYFLLSIAPISIAHYTKPYMLSYSFLDYDYKKESYSWVI